MEKLLNPEYTNIDLFTAPIFIFIELFTELISIAIRLSYKPQSFLLLTYHRLIYTTIEYRLITKTIIYIDYRVTNIAIYIRKPTFYTIYTSFLALN